MGALSLGLRGGQPFFPAARALSGGRGISSAAEISRRASRCWRDHSRQRRHPQGEMGCVRQGQSGGVRIVYYWLRAQERIHLLLIYGKGEKENVTPHDLRRVRALLQEIDNG